VIANRVRLRFCPVALFAREVLQTPRPFAFNHVEPERIEIRLINDLVSHQIEALLVAVLAPPCTEERDEAVVVA